MNTLISRYFCLYPAAIFKGEPIAYFRNTYSKNQWMTRKELKKLQFKNLKSILNYAQKSSDFYQELYKNHNFFVEQLISTDDINNIPTVSKSDLIDHIDSISIRNPGFFTSRKTTGGSTGQPVTVLKNSIALARERCVTARSYEWAGIKLGDSQLRFWGIPHNSKDRYRAQLIDFVSNRTRVSAFDLSAESYSKYYRLAGRVKPKFIYGYVSVIEQLADYMLSNNLSPIESVKSIITTSEILTEKSRSKIQNAFQVRVFNEYGCGEVGSIAHECEHGNMHVMADNMLVETDSKGNSPGEIIVTDFYNTASPLIRYRLGDYATLSDMACPCGRGLPVIEAIHGRAYDILKMPSGKEVHPESIIYIFEGLQAKTKAFKQFQVIQSHIDRIELRIVPNVEWSDEVLRLMISEVKKYIDMHIDFSVSLVGSIDREASGKMRLVKRSF
jgi:phenylacetate-coenzyme A ligase PaaK-like adenylate-forming protein